MVFFLGVQEGSRRDHPAPTETRSKRQEVFPFPEEIVFLTLFEDHPIPRTLQRSNKNFWCRPLQHFFEGPGQEPCAHFGKWLQAKPKSWKTRTEFSDKKAKQNSLWDFVVYPTKSLLALSLVERGENWTQSPKAESNKDREKHCANPPTLPICTIWAICVWMCPTLTVCQKKNELDGGLRWWYLFMLLLKLSERKTTLKYVLPLFSFSQCVCWCAWARLSASPKRRSRLRDDNFSVRGSSTLATKRKCLRGFLFVALFHFPGAF